MNACPRWVLVLLAITVLGTPILVEAACTLECEDFLLWWRNCDETSFDCPAGYEEACNDGTCGLVEWDATGICYRNQIGLPYIRPFTLTCRTLIDPPPESLEPNSTRLPRQCFESSSTRVGAKEKIQQRDSKGQWALVMPGPTPLGVVDAASSPAFGEEAKVRVARRFNDPDEQSPVGVFVIDPPANRGGIRHQWDDARIFDGPAGFMVTTFEVDATGKASKGVIEGSSLPAAEQERLLEWILDGLYFTVEDVEKIPAPVFAVVQITELGAAALAISY